MTINEIKRVFPNASASTLARNGIEAPPAKEIIAAAYPAPMTIRHTNDESKLNKTERRFLEILRRRSTKIGIQNITLKLADNCRYTPDFSTLENGRLTFWEIKGAFTREDAWIKLKVAARMYPEFDFILCRWQDNQWTETKVQS